MSSRLSQANKPGSQFTKQFMPTASISIALNFVRKFIAAIITIGGVYSMEK